MKNETLSLINAALSNPLTIRSHFLCKAPVIALSHNYTGLTGVENSNQYVLLHEYLHYENFTSWPFLAMDYFWRSYRTYNRIYSYKHHKKFTINKNSILNQKNPQFQTLFSRLPDGKYKIVGEIGADTLIEASAILSYRIKLEGNPLHEYSENVVGHLLRNLDEPKNLVHSKSVSMLTSLKLPEQLVSEFKDKDVSYKLPALIPGNIATKTFGYSMLLCGLDENVRDWRTIFDFIMQNDMVLWETYLRKLREILDEVFFRNDFEQYLNIEPLRDISIIGFHGFLNLTNLWMVKTSMPDGNLNDKLPFFTLSPLMNIIRIYEAMNADTLKKANAPLLKPRWVPIPVIAFSNKVLESLRLDFDNSPNDWFRMRWTASLSDQEDLYTFLRWFGMLFTSELAIALEMKQMFCQCPIYKWTIEQFKRLGSQDKDDSKDFLGALCNSSFLNRDYENLNNRMNVQPSEEYCRYSLRKKKQETSMKDICLFHQVMRDSLLRP